MRQLFVNKLPVLAVLCLVAVTLSGCGKKPGMVDAPQGATETFPRTYPDPATDPSP